MRRVVTGILLLQEFIWLSFGLNIPDLKDAGDSLIDIVLSDEFDDLFQRGNVKVDGLTLLRHIEANTKLQGKEFENLFHHMLGEKSLEGLGNKKYTWDQATDVINALIKLADNISVNVSKKPNTKYQHEDERISKAKKQHKENYAKATQKEEL